MTPFLLLIPCRRKAVESIVRQSAEIHNNRKIAMTRTLMPLSVILAAIMSASCQTSRTNTADQQGLVTKTDGIAEQEIRDILNEDLRKAMSLKSADAQSQIASFEQNYAKGYISVAQDGTVYTLSEILREIREQGPNNRVFDSVRMDDAQVRIHGDAAVATYVMNYTGQRDGSSFRSSIRESAVFVKRNGKWLRILEQRSNAHRPRE